MKVYVVRAVKHNLFTNDHWLIRLFHMFVKDTEIQLSKLEIDDIVLGDEDFIYIIPSSEQEFSSKNSDIKNLQQQLSIS